MLNFILGMMFWQIVVFIIALISKEDEEITMKIGIGFCWLFVIIVGIFMKLTQWNNIENQSNRILKSAKKMFNKKNPDWKKWYKKYGKYSYLAWNDVQIRCPKLTNYLKENKIRG